MSIVILGTHIFNGDGNDVDIPLSGQLALGFNQYNELSVKDSDGIVWQIGGMEIENLLVQFSYTDTGVSNYEDLTSTIIAQYINTLLITVSKGQLYYFEVSGPVDERKLFILREKSSGLINITSTDLILINSVESNGSAPDLQSVLDNGQSASKDAGVSFVSILGGEVNYRNFNVGVYADAIGTNHTELYFNPNSINFYNHSPFKEGGINVNNGDFYFYQKNETLNKDTTVNFNLPVETGTISFPAPTSPGVYNLPIKINGQVANAQGEITIVTGGTPQDLQSVIETGGGVVLGTDSFNILTGLPGDREFKSVILNSDETKYSEIFARHNFVTVGSVLADGGGDVLKQGYFSVTNGETDILQGNATFDTRLKFINPVAFTNIFVPAMPLAGDYTLATTSDFKTINGESVIGTGNIVSGGGSGDMLLATVQTVTGDKTFLDGKLLLRNVGDTFSSYFTNVNTANRVYSLQNRNGILLDDTDLATTVKITGGQSIAGTKTFSDYIQFSVDNGFTSGGSSPILKRSGDHIGIASTTLSGFARLDTKLISTSVPKTFSFPDKDGVVALVEDVAAIRPYKIYVALVSQSGTSAPSPTVLESTLSAPITWTYGGVGYYYGNRTGAFTDGKTYLTISGGLGIGADIVKIARISDNTIMVTTANHSGGAVDGVLASASVEVRVYN